MSITQSDNRLEQHPKPTQEYERQLVGGNYVDWPDFATLNATYSVYYRKNKYFWVAGVYYQADNDGTTYRQISNPGGGAVFAGKYAINADGSGTPGSNFDGYLAAGNTVTIPALSGKTLINVIVNKISYQDYVNDGNKISLSGTTLNLTNMGGVYAGDWLIVYFR